jgi:hypothetical protein
MMQGLPSQVEIAGIVHVNHLVWAGASYRQHYGISALGGIKLGNTLAIGGSYSIQQRSVDNLSSPSFEASLSYLFGKREKGVPVYSFVNDVKPKERVPPTNRRSVADRRPVADQTKPVAPRTASVQPRTNDDQKPQEKKVLEKPVETDAPVLTERSQTVETPRNDERPVSVESESERKSPPVDADDNDPQRIKALPEDLAVNVRHETVRRGDHKDELAAGEYVIAGVFKSSANAKNFSDGLRSLDYAPAYGYGSEKDLWYVYLFKSQDAERARARHVKLSKLFLLRDAWLLTVEP